MALKTVIVKDGHND